MSKQQKSLRKRLLVLAVTGAVGCAGVAMAAAPAGAGRFSVLTAATHLASGDVVQNTVPLNKPIRVAVVLKLRDEAGMSAFLQQAHVADAPHVMSRAQLDSHLPTLAQAQAVADYLKGAGFNNVKISPDRMIVNATGNAAAVQSAFQTSMVGVRTSDGRQAFANNSPIHVPAALSDSVQAVLGLQTVHKAHILAHPVPHGTIGVAGHNPMDFASIYDANGLPPATSVNAAVFGWGSMSQTLTDLGTFTAQNSLAPVNTKVVCIDYGGYNNGVISTTDPTCKSFDEGSIEWDLDSQDIVGMTGGVKSLTFYAAYGGYNTSITNALNEIVTPTAGEPVAQVVNMSFGECERFEDSGQGGDGSAQADDALFQVAASQGRTFSASTGDSGSDECGDGNANSASYPASSPWVVAVSGTTLRASTTTWARENVWIDAGGSPSSFEKARSWQAPLTYGTYAGARGPDVAFDASPSSGAIIINYGSSVQVGGTSLSSPLFVGAWSRILQGHSALGFAAPHLYALPASALHDILAGNNGQYIAKPGWDWATGRGSFDVGKAAAALK